MKPNTTYEDIDQIPFGAQVDVDSQMQAQADEIIEKARLEMKSRAIAAMVEGAGSSRERFPYEPRVYPHRWWEWV